MTKTVPDRLTALASLYRERNTVYGDDYRRYGRVMLALFPGGISIQSEADLSRFGVLTQMLGKLGRYAANFSHGGHSDSLNDLAVYAQILALLDSEAHQPFETPFPDAASITGTSPWATETQKCVHCNGFGMRAGEVCEECSGTGMTQLLPEDQEEEAPTRLETDTDTVSGLTGECPECRVAHFQLHKSHCSIPSQLAAAAASRVI